MQEIPILGELGLVIAVAVVVTVVLSRLRLPTVAGLLASGALMGPSGLGWVSSVHDIELLAEVGVVLLLFTIGLEFSLARLRDIFRQVALGGALQVGLTTLAAWGVSVWAGEGSSRGIFWGFAVALSSTAIVLRTLSERQELQAPHGRFIVGTLIFQDLCVVPMVLIVPLLGSEAPLSELLGSVGLALLKAAAVVVALVGVSRLLAPRLLSWVDASRSREVFLLAILGLCIGTAWLTSLVGLSLALGAFLGGMVVADTEYGHRAMSDILPLRHAFVSIFFVVLGMLFDVGELLGRPAVVLGLLAALLLGKGAVATLAAMVMRFPARAAWLAGVGLAQFGEFGFVLIKLAQSNGLIEAADARPLLTAGILSMFLTPLLVRAAPHVTAGERLLAPLERIFGVKGVDAVGEEGEALSGHVILVGFGVGGALAATALRGCGRGLVALEMNLDNVRRGRAEGFPVYYGDATSEEALEHAQIKQARLMVLLVNDPEASRRIVDTARRLSPWTPILMRTRFLSERAGLLAQGAQDVVAEEVEGAVEVVARMLRALELPRNLIEERLHALRLETQTTERRQTLPRPRLGEVGGAQEMKIETFQVAEGAAACGATLRALSLQQRTGALVIAARRGEVMIEPPDPDFLLAPGDQLFLVGRLEAVAAGLALLGEPAQRKSDAPL